MNTDWHKAVGVGSKHVSSGDEMYALAHSTSQSPQQAFYLVRATGEGLQQHMKWEIPITSNMDWPALASWGDRKDADRIFLFCPQSSVCGGRVIPATNAFPRPANLLTSPIPIQEVLAADFSPEGVLWLCRNTNTGLRLTAFASEHAVMSDLPFDIEGSELPSMTVLKTHVLLGVEGTLHTCDISGNLPGGKISKQEFDQPILGLVSCQRWAMPHVAVVMPEQVGLTWFSGTQLNSYVIEERFERPRAAMTKDGILVVLNGNEGRLFHCDSRGVKASKSFSLSGEEPIAVVAGSEAGTFATLDPSGNVRVYRLGVGLFRT